MMTNWIPLRPALWLVAVAMLVLATCAQARVTCTPSSSGVSTAYGSALNVVAATFTVTCTKSNTQAPTVTFQVGANYGANPAGTQNRARLGATGNYLNYRLYLDSGCATQWQNTATTNRIPNPAEVFTMASTTNTQSFTFSFYACIPANQTVPAAGTYTDSTITMTITGSVSIGLSTFNTGTFAVSITAPSTCSLTSAPGTMTFNYTSFSTSAALASTTFTATCTNLLPYTLSLDAGGTGYTGSFTSPTGTYTNTATNLTYTLTLPTPSLGTGAAQAYTITGTMAATQGGKCGSATCSVTDVHTLTVTY
jgi:spore coat protein U-like protein